MLYLRISYVKYIYALTFENWIPASPPPSPPAIHLAASVRGSVERARNAGGGGGTEDALRAAFRETDDAFLASISTEEVGVGVGAGAGVGVGDLGAGVGAGEGEGVGAGAGAGADADAGVGVGVYAFASAPKSCLCVCVRVCLRVCVE
jgi:hypothetical protein